MMRVSERVMFNGLVRDAETVSWRSTTLYSGSRSCVSLSIFLAVVHCLEAVCVMQTSVLHCDSLSYGAVHLVTANFEQGP